ncbi:hypothetical protein C8R43DRAFT_959134 [Mycena crocata]|nr:hypothetical protein C8R43DRAFT_959134 [Mycena crocata]
MNRAICRGDIRRAERKQSVQSWKIDPHGLQRIILNILRRGYQQKVGLGTAFRCQVLRNAANMDPVELTEAEGVGVGEKDGHGDSPDWSPPFTEVNTAKTAPTVGTEPADGDLLLFSEDREREVCMEIVWKHCSTNRPQRTSQ